MALFFLSLPVLLGKCGVVWFELYEQRKITLLRHSIHHEMNCGIVQAKEDMNKVGVRRALTESCCTTEYALPATVQCPYAP
jgi:hypothetical protein